MIFFTADFHLSHRNIIEYCSRPFKNIKDMDRAILQNLEESLRPKDVLYFLGDLTFKEKIAHEFFKKFSDIEVEIHFIVGNHDSKSVIKIAQEYCAFVGYLKNIKIEGQHITLCHYAMLLWDKSHFNSWQLFGHSHGRLSLTGLGKQYDVGVDNNGFYPVSFDRLLGIMKERPNNFNYIP